MHVVVEILSMGRVCLQVREPVELGIMSYLIRSVKVVCWALVPPILEPVVGL